MLRTFFPEMPNKSYLRLVEVHESTNEERDVLLATNALSAGHAAGGGSGEGDGPAGLTIAADGANGWSKREYRGIEAALERLASRIAAAAARGERYDGCVAFSQGANLLLSLIHI